MRIEKELEELFDKGLIDSDTNKRLKEHYASEEPKLQARMVTIFGILGAFLIGLGIILIIAHNWDNLPRTLKTILSFLPLLIAQGACVLAFVKFPDKKGWMEGSSVLLFFSIGASISLISQVYNIPGDFTAFLLTWMVLAWPLLYLMKSSVVSILYFIGITVYYFSDFETGYAPFDYLFSAGLILAGIPHYYLLVKKSPESFFTLVHNWLLPFVFMAHIPFLDGRSPLLYSVGFFSVLGTLYLIGNRESYKNIRKINGFYFWGFFGTLIGLFILSFSGFWDAMLKEKLTLVEQLGSPQTIGIIFWTFFGLWGLARNFKAKESNHNNPISFVFIGFIFLFIIGKYSSIAPILVNLILLGIGIYYVFRGAKLEDIKEMNIGMVIIVLLAVCRFFDDDYSFILRGIFLLLVGMGFFVSNYWMLKRLKQNEKE